jgi:hypothetical protein
VAVGLHRSRADAHRALAAGAEGIGIVDGGGQERAAAHIDVVEGFDAMERLADFRRKLAFRRISEMAAATTITA